GGKVIDRLAADLRAEFPAMTGLSRANLYSMRAFADAWPAEAIVQRAVGRLGWGQVVDLLTKLDDPEARDWYAAAADTGGWTRDVLANQIMNRTRERFGAAPSNFVGHLEAGDSELAQQLAKDPYVFDFLGLSAGVAERDLEQALMDRMVDTLRELGTGFAFVGRQVHFDVDGDDFYLDLLFFEIPQLRYVVIELKIGKFEPGYAGQLGFYVALVDDKLRNPDVHKPTVGLLMCRDRNETVVRYSLGATTSPVAVSTYTYDALPPEEQAALPSEADMVRALTLTTATAQANWNVSPTAGARVTQGESPTDEQ
ncbi:MAG: PDDEXK nuclease domain-containing protein, partial [Propionibacterium sp.]|nr:PDDEXK nuclease domain-containing protein [Propionibacterium sp.]